MRVAYQGKVPARIRSDRKRLKQILLNLIGNAIKFTHQGSVQVLIRFLPDDTASRIQFEVSDTGIGMSLRQQEKLFQAFSQVDDSQDWKQSGTGLGLVISKRLAEMLGGDISVESQFDKGSKFTLTIPIGPLESLRLIDPRDRDASVVLERSSDELAGQLRGRILVVDDRREMRFIAQHFIEEAGGQVVAAENGQEALNIVMSSPASATSIDLIVMDMQMPVLDGFEATRRLRAAGFDRPIVALTAYAMEGDRQACLDAGCTDYVTKPLHRPHFVQILAHHLNASHEKRSASNV